MANAAQGLTGDTKRLLEIVKVMSKYKVMQGFDPDKLCEMLKELGPTFVKLGQLLSMHPEIIPMEYCKKLESLRTDASTLVTAQIREIISEEYGKDIRYCSNRKEVKDHGDKGILLGSPIEDGDKVVIIEDVTTAGTSIQETLPIIKAQGDVSPIGLVVSVDRMERGQGTKSALKEIEEKYGLKTTAIVTMAEVVEHLYNKEYKGKVIIDDTLKAAIDAYYEQYGAE